MSVVAQIGQLLGILFLGLAFARGDDQQAQGRGGYPGGDAGEIEKDGMRGDGDGHAKTQRQRRRDRC